MPRKTARARAKKKTSVKSEKPRPGRAKKKTSRGGAAASERIRTFRTSRDFAAWLARNHDKSSGIWARIAKKGGKLKSMTYDEALEIALCYGWIDALRRSHDESAYLQRYVPRRPKSLWSKVNREKAIALIERGEMKPPGLAEVERAKRDGRWDVAYDPPARAEVPEELDAALKKNRRAKDFFDTINRTNRYAVIWRLQTAKTPETRARRLAALVAMLEKGEKFH